MADALKLDEVANDAGFRRRIGHMLLKRALAVVPDVGADPAELAVSKLLLADSSGGEIISRFCRSLVSDTTVANGLEANNYNHLAVTDAAAEPRVLAVFTTYAQAYV